MGCAASEDCDFLVRIKDVPGWTTGKSTISVLPIVNSSGDVNASGSADTDGTDIKFVLNKYVMNKLGLSFPTDGTQICVVPAPTTIKDCSGTASQFPSSAWYFVGNMKAKSFTLHVPPLSSGQQFKYFLNLKAPQGQTVVIDPKIGCCEAQLPRLVDWAGKFGLSVDVLGGLIAVVALLLGFGTARRFYAGNRAR